MITTITFNPAIDKRYVVDSLCLNEVNRVLEVQNTAGGKGINVSRVASLLGVKVAATGFLGGKTGEFISEKIRELGIEDSFVKIKGETRSCLAIISSNLKQTEILEPGPVISDEEMNEWLAVYEGLLGKSNIVCASGSLPRGLDKSSYAEVIRMAEKRGAKFLLDTSGDALLEGIEAKPYFIKPNVDELKTLTGKDINSFGDIINTVDILHEKGIKFVVVSLGKDGSIAGFEGRKYKVSAPKVKAVNSVGSGDSFVAGIAAGLERGLEIEETLKIASACGTANAVEKHTGCVDVDNVNRLMKLVNIEII